MNGPRLVPLNLRPLRRRDLFRRNTIVCELPPIVLERVLLVGGPGALLIGPAPDTLAVNLRAVRLRDLRRRNVLVIELPLRVALAGGEG